MRLGSRGSSFPARAGKTYDLLSSIDMMERVMSAEPSTGAKGPTLQAAESLDAFIERAHSALDLETTAYDIANEGRRVLGCDRLSVAICRDAQSQLVAISGVDTVSRRANSVRLLERLINAVLESDQTIAVTGSTENIPPHIAGPLRKYLAETSAHNVAVIPLRFTTSNRDGSGTTNNVGALVVEQFNDDGSLHAEQRKINTIVRHSTLALRNAAEHQQQSSLWARLGGRQFRRRLKKTLLILTTLAVIAALMFVPTDFTVEGTGELQPLNQRDVFAGADGIVSTIHTNHADQVQADDLLIELRRPQLEFEISRVLGELQTTRQRLATARTARLQTTGSTQSTSVAVQQYAVAEEELRQTIKNLEKQREILELQTHDLNVRSPLSGQVITWDLEKRLSARPVQRGQRLMTVAELDGPWILEIELPDHRTGHVIDAQKSLQPGLDVSYIIASNPEVTHHGTLESVSTATDFDETERPTVTLRVSIDRDDIKNLRPGATVMARVHCGERSIGYAWFHDLIDAVRMWFLF